MVATPSAGEESRSLDSISEEACRLAIFFDLPTPAGAGRRSVILTSRLWWNDRL